MSSTPDPELEGYYKQAASWSADREASRAASQRAAWTVAAVATLIALLEALALAFLLPLKTVVPYMVLVDRQTGNVQALKPSVQQTITPDDALARSLLAQYVTARESFDINTLQNDYRKVALWSAGDARDRYVASMQASNPLSPLSALPRQTVVSVQVLSITSLNADTALVRFTTVRSDPGAQPTPTQNWVAAIKYRFSASGMSEADRWLNPLGFQVMRYRRSAEAVPPPAPSLPGQSLPGSPQALP